MATNSEESDYLNKEHVGENTMGEEFEKLIHSTGGMGRFQKTIVLFVFGSKISLGMGMILMSFGAKIPDWWCDDVETHSGFSTNDSLSRTRSCYHNDTICSNPTFSDEMVTVASQFRLICDQKWISGVIISTQLGGLLVGGFVCGQLADTFGRKKTYFALLLAHVVLNVLSAPIPVWVLFAAARFMIGFTIGGCMVMDTTIPIEFSPARWRSYVPSVPAWDTGCLLFALIVYVLKDWRYVSLITAAITAPFLVGWWFVPESMRWLLVHGKVSEAEQVVKDMARSNGKPCPNLAILEKLSAMESKRRESTDKKYTYLDLWNNWETARNSIIIGFTWFSMGFGLYGISFGVVALSGDIFINLIISGAMGIPGVMCTGLLTNTFGRRWAAFGLCLLCGLSSLAVVPMSYTDLPIKGAVINGLAMAGKLFVNAEWTAHKIHTAELYPTAVRNIGMGYANGMARIGAIIAPQFIYLEQLNGSLMYLVIGVIEVAAACACLMLPETNGRALHDVIGGAKLKSEKVESEAIV